MINSKEYLTGWNDGKREQLALCKKKNTNKSNGNILLASISSLIISIILIFIFNFNYYNTVIATFVSILILNEFIKEYALAVEDEQK